MSWVQLRGHRFHFIQASFDAESNEAVQVIHITDLVRVWSCTCSRNQIVNQAEVRLVNNYIATMLSGEKQL